MCVELSSAEIITYELAYALPVIAVSSFKLKHNASQLQMQCDESAMYYLISGIWSLI